MHRCLSTFTILALTGQLIGSPAFAAESDSVARKLLNTQGCKACHALEGGGGTAAKSFEEIRDNLSPIDIRLQLVNQAGQHGNSRIPDFSHLSEGEIEALVNFMTNKIVNIQGE